jgi:hypothetical protein
MHGFISGVWGCCHDAWELKTGDRPTACISGHSWWAGDVLANPSFSVSVSFQNV